MHTMKKLLKPKIAVIGCGYWGKNIIRTLHELNALHSVCDYDEKLALKFAEQFNVKVFQFDQIEGQLELDGVCIASPAETHRDIAIKLISLNIPLFIEKPLATTNEDAEEIKNAAIRNKNIVQVGHLLRYHKGFIAVQKLIEDGVIGKIIHIHSTRKSFGKVRNNENVMWSFAPHDISMILALAQERPIEISSYNETSLHNNIVDTGEIFLKFKKFSAKISVSWLSAIKEHKLIITGSEETIVFDDTQDWNKKVKVIKNRIKLDRDLLEIEKGIEEFIEIEESQPLYDELSHFIDCIENGNEPLTNVSEGVSVIEVLERL
mgnify:CR=1 FL=1